MNAPTAVVLAAGKGTRMCSAQPKVLHRAAGRPLLGWVIEAARQAGCGRILVVVGHARESVREAFANDHDITWVVQENQRGTGHALAQARVALEQDEGQILVLSGDVPLVTPRTLERLLAATHDCWGALATATLDDPGRLGRIIADDDRLVRIVEHADADAGQRAIRTINAGIYALRSPGIFADLDALGSDNAQGELYLTDAVSAAATDGRGVAMVALDSPSEAFGVNDRRDLATVHRALVDRQIDHLMTRGVTFLDPQTTTVEAGVEVGMDSVIHPGVSLLGTTTLGAGVTVHSGAWLEDARVADGATIKPMSVLEGAIVRDGATAGPFARLRPGADIGEGAAVGNFVEIKKSRLGPGVKAGHLAYLGDADVGAGTNIGAGVITCNYDGASKHPTTIGEGAFVGSDTMLVAPVSVGSGATTGAGSVITHDVPEGALAVGRSRQRNIPDWRRRNRSSGKEEKD